MSYPKKIYCTTFEEAMAAIPEAAHFHIFGYICCNQKRPDEYIQSSIQSANFQVKTIDFAISRLGFCLLGEKGKEKRRLKREKSKWLEYISLLREVMYFCSHNDLVKTTSLLKKYADVTKCSLDKG